MRWVFIIEIWYKVDIALRKFGEQDFDRLIGWIETPAQLSDWSATVFSYPLTHEQLADYLASASDAAPGRRIFTALDRDDGGRPLGHVELSHIWPHLSARISRVLVGGAENRGRGIGPVVVRSLIDLAFAEYQVERIDLGTTTANRAAIRCYEKLGFAAVGIWPGAFESPAGPVDVAWMTLRRR